MEASIEQSEFIAAVRGHAARLSRSRGVDHETVRREVAAIPDPSELTVELLEHACGADASEAPTDPFERLLLALVLRRAVKGTDHEERWRAPLSYEAAAALQQLRKNVRLYPLRLEMLDELIEHGGPPALLAEWHYARACTHVVLDGSPASPSAFEDLRHALVFAIEAQHVDMAALSTSALCKAVAALPTETPRTLVEEVLSLADAGLSLGIEGYNRALVLHGRACLLHPNDPGRAAESLAEAIELLPVDAPFRIELGASHVSSLVAAGRLEDAETAAARYLAAARDVSSEVEVGMLHAAMGQVATKRGDLDDAKSHYGQALSYFRGRDLRNELDVRLRLAILHLEREEWEALDEHVRQVRAHEGALDPEQRADLGRIEADAAKDRGRLDEQRAIIDRAAEAESHGASAVGARLERARLALASRRELVDDLDALIVAAVDEYGDVHQVTRLVEDVVCNFKDHALDSITLGRVAAWAVSNRRFTVLAHIQHRSGDVQGARETLRRALELPPSDQEYLACLHTLMCLLEEHDHDERASINAKVERLLDSHDEPTIRVDLATSFRRESSQNPDALPRAWYHARRAWESTSSGPGLLPNESAFRLHIAQTASTTLLELLRSRLPESSVDMARLAGWLDTDLPLPLEQRGEVRLSAVSLLLATGPFSHPDSIHCARRLTSLAKEDLGDTELVRFAEARLEWIKHRQESGSSAPAPAHPKWSGGPLDEAHGWLVDLVAGRRSNLDPRVLSEHLDLLHHALLARLDVADAALAQVVAVSDEMDSAASSRVQDMALDLVRRVHWDGGADRPWAELQATVGKMAGDQGAPGFRTLAAAIARARGEAPAPTSSESDDAEEHSPEHMQEWFERAVALMQQVESAEAVEPARGQIDEARVLLARAVEVARRHRRPELFACMVSLGNAWKLEPGADLDRALAIYDQAGELPEQRDQEGQLCKVKADALVQRGTPEDFREAKTLLERAAELRTGRFKAEALWSLAKLYGQDPELPRVQQLQRSVEALVQVIRADLSFGELVLPTLLGGLAAWEDQQPRDPRPARVRDELLRILPHRSEDVRSRQPRLSEDAAGLLVNAIKHPACEVLLRVSSRLQPPTELDAAGRLSPEQVAAIREQVDRESLLDDSQGLQEELRRVEDEAEGSDAKRPGVLAARVLLLSTLARMGRGSSTLVRQATDKALSAVDAVPEEAIRAFIITQLARVWIPGDHAQDPVRDFDFAAELLEQAMRLQGGEDSALVDTIEFLARARRYSSGGEPAANLMESRRLYRLLLERARRQGMRDLAANTLNCLAEIEDHLGEGERSERMERCDKLFLEAIEMAESPTKQAEYRANLALTRTQAAGRLLGQEREAKLRQALALFQQVDTSLLSPAQRGYYASNRVLCETMLARQRGDRQGVLRAWRAHLDGISPYAPVLRATAQHNYALALLDDGRVVPDDLREAIRMFEEAAWVRLAEPNVRHRWETALDIGRSIARAMDPSDPLPAEGLPWGPDQAWEQAKFWLEKAAEAAEVLGPGQELAEAGYWLAELVASSASNDLALDVAERAWSVLDAATPFLATSTVSREVEARVSYRVASTLAHRLAPSDPRPELTRVRWVLDGDAAGPALRWISRAQQATRRAVRARLSWPQGVSAAVWNEWKRALRGDDPSVRTEALRRVREAAPTFLSFDAELEQTWGWIEARPGAAAVASLGYLLLVLRVDEEGDRRVSLLGLDIEPPPSDPSQLPQAMREFLKRSDEHVPYAALTAWARESVVEPLYAFVGDTPSTVLWIPDSRLRSIPPSAIWGQVPVASAISIDLLDARSFPGRHASTLVGLADPGDLRRSGVVACRALANEAALNGPIRVIASSGPLHGTALFDHPSIRDTPISIKDLLAEAPEHRTMVLIAHGAVCAEDPMRASIVCVNALGEAEHLDVEQLAEHPDAFAGARIILMSCSGGLLGSTLADPGGLAGTLISAGARWVVAPLWPITVGTANDLGRALLQGLSRGDEPWEILASIAVDGAGTAGGRRSVEVASFVAWVG